jgi:hypothetical protein
MSDATPLMTRYLLGQLSEREQADLEGRYFEDARVFDQLAEVETALVDDNVRDRLSTETRARFESHYLADPLRRERVRFAQALVTTLDRGDSSTPAAAPAPEPTGRLAWLVALRGPQLAMGLAATVVLVAVGAWLFNQAQRVRQDATTTVTTGAPRGADPSIAPGAADAPPVSTLPANTTAPTATGPPARPVLAVATLALMVGPGERSATPREIPVLTIPPGTDQVRLVLSLREHDYARYRVIVRTIGGAELFREGNLVPVTGGTQPTFTLTLPAARFESGDYMLTLQGSSAASAYEDLSQTLYRVEARR